MTNVYVDGFDLFYGALKGTPYKWLDLTALSRILLPRDQIGMVNPQKPYKRSQELQGDFFRQLRASVVARVQLPDPIWAAGRKIHKPERW